ncbi:MAG: hypothetical protein WC700_07605 [Gemmatimonadaceae bacterium]|jgi:hypothetical protein
MRQEQGRLDAELVDAARRGDMNQLRACRGWGAEGVGTAMAAAAAGGHEDVVSECILWQAHDARDFERALATAARAGRMGVMHLIHSHCDDEVDYDWPMAAAAYGGHAGALRLCREWGAHDYERALAEAAGRGHEHIMRLCRDWGARDYDRALVAAARRGRRREALVCLEWGATGVEAAILAATEAGQSATANELRRSQASDNLVD